MTDTIAEARKFFARADAHWSTNTLEHVNALIALAERGPVMPEEPSTEALDAMADTDCGLIPIYRALRAYLLAQQKSRSPTLAASGSTDSVVPKGNSGKVGERDTEQQKEDVCASPRDEPQPEYVTRIDLDDKGIVDDVAISHVDMFRLERMSAGSWWLMAYTARGNYRFSLYTPRNSKIDCTHEVEPPDPRGEANSPPAKPKGWRISWGADLSNVQVVQCWTERERDGLIASFLSDSSRERVAFKVEPL